MLNNILNDANIKLKYRQQKAGAKTRGIEWSLTFDDWLAWWGDDINNRGLGRNQLQMQRFHDKGAYELGNIIKDYPARNAKTRGYVMKSKTQEKLAMQHQASLDALMFNPSSPDEEVYMSEYEAEMTLSNAKFTTYAIDR